MKKFSELEERTARRNVVYEGKILTLRVDDALLPDGTPCRREIVDHPGGAAVLAEYNGKIALVRQFRYAYGEVISEIPAGKLERGEEPARAAARELSEETGLEADELVPLFVLYPTPGYTNEKIHVFEARGVRAGRQHLDRGEFLNVEYLSPERALEQIRSGGIRDGKTVAAILYRYGNTK